jgi:EAL domain-containing protein (putative c-di-GMP-specific phosphodiesterase class I)
MPRPSRGEARQQQAWSLISALLTGKGTLPITELKSAGVDVTYQGWEEGGDLLMIVKGTLSSLSQLTEPRLDPEVVRELLNYQLGPDFLGILLDKQSPKAGRSSSEWCFTAKLWSIDLNKNKQEFNSLWGIKKQGISTVSASKTISNKLLAVKISTGRSLLPLQNSLEVYEPFIDEIVETINTRYSTYDQSKSSEIDYRNFLLDIIQSTTGTDAVLVGKYDKKHSQLSIDPAALRGGTQFSEILQDDILPNISKKDIFSTDSHGRIFGHEDCVYLFIPLDAESSSPSHGARFLILCNVPDESIILGEAAGKIISTVYKIGQDSIESRDLIEAKIFDELKKSFNFVPFSLYNRRYEMFCKQLYKMTVYFQPIVDFKNFRVEGWEALARDPDTLTAPQSLFKVAELWGVQFMTELDLYFLRTATRIYQEQRIRLNLQRAQEVIPLAVNVYPDSLMRDSYLDAVRDIIKNEVVPSGKLILEISEKSALPHPAYWDEEKPSWDSFGMRLIEFRRKGAKVRFAIDDFGVGHASISRLVGLKLDYIKIDREVLNYASKVRLGIIDFVYSTLLDSHQLSPKIVLEGVDIDYQVDMEHLTEIDAFIQGYAVDKAIEKIYKRLPTEKYESLKRQLHN